MDVIFGLLGFLGFFIGIIMLIVSVIKRKRKKVAFIIIVCGIILFIIGCFMPDSEDNKTNSDIDIQSTTENNTQEESGEVSDVSEQISENVIYSVTSDQDAINAVKKYEETEGFSDPDDKFEASKKDSYYEVIAGSEYNGSEWKEKGCVYNVDIYTGDVLLIGNVVDMNIGNGTSNDEKKSFSFNNIGAYDLFIEESTICGQHVVGYVKNNSSNVENINLLFNYYDKDNVIIGNDNQLIENIKPGEVAKVSVYAPYYTTAFEITDIQIINYVIHY